MEMILRVVKFIVSQLDFVQSLAEWQSCVPLSIIGLSRHMPVTTSGVAQKAGLYHRTPVGFDQWLYALGEGSRRIVAEC